MSYLGIALAAAAICALTYLIYIVTHTNTQGTFADYNKNLKEQETVSSDIGLSINKHLPHNVYIRMFPKYRDKEIAQKMHENRMSRVTPMKFTEGEDF